MVFSPSQGDISVLSNMADDAISTVNAPSASIPITSSSSSLSRNANDFSSNPTQNLGPSSREEGRDHDSYTNPDTGISGGNFSSAHKHGCHPQRQETATMHPTMAASVAPGPVEPPRAGYGLSSSSVLNSFDLISLFSDPITTENPRPTHSLQRGGAETHIQQPYTHFGIFSAESPQQTDTSVTRLDVLGRQDHGTRPRSLHCIITIPEDDPNQQPIQHTHPFDQLVFRLDTGRPYEDIAVGHPPVTAHRGRVRHTTSEIQGLPNHMTDTQPNQESTPSQERVFPPKAAPGAGHMDPSSQEWEDHGTPHPAYTPGDTGTEVSFYSDSDSDFDCHSDAGSDHDRSQPAHSPGQGAPLFSSQPQMGSHTPDAANHANTHSDSVQNIHGHFQQLSLTDPWVLTGHPRGPLPHSPPPRTTHIPHFRHHPTHIWEPYPPLTH